MNCDECGESVEFSRWMMTKGKCNTCRSKEIKSPNFNVS